MYKVYYSYNSLGENLVKYRDAFATLEEAVELQAFSADTNRGLYWWVMAAPIPSIMIPRDPPKPKPEKVYAAVYN